ncbi:type IV pilin N-terminal domain-containing protein [Haloarcula sp. S1AR25-5A]|uniref:Type IV pilin N-terminal domain-containing protein n=1 Tax=Haloarcula terrestris TaxID=2950533 RepID=A0AAE4ET79_9EURY|nr:type IV pilin N-terminal domain-containing protein [Haloarcula terrestris]MDS0219791.1 type IV pilin N-terminal domain-containing protein [Haloarcula terrestris]
MTDSSRGQSETVGIVLLTAVIVVLVSVLGAGILSSGPQPAERPLVNLDIDITANNVNITHSGGDTVDGASLDVGIRNETASQRYESVVTGQFTPTDTVPLPHTLTGTVTVLVIDTGSNSVLGRESTRPDTETAAAAGMPAIEPERRL